MSFNDTYKMGKEYYIVEHFDIMSHYWSYNGYYISSTFCKSSGVPKGCNWKKSTWVERGRMRVGNLCPLVIREEVKIVKQ